MQHKRTCSLRAALAPARPAPKHWHPSTESTEERARYALPSFGFPLPTASAIGVEGMCTRCAAGTGMVVPVTVAVATYRA